MGLRDRPPVEIVGPLPSWPQDFCAIGGELRGLLGSDAVRIDHIGSTSVPGLAAKDIIDVQVTVASLEPWDSIPSRLAASRYRENAAARDHVPPGGTTEEPLWRKRLFDAPENRRHAHIHIREAGRPNQRYALLFRDYLRTHDDAAATYLAAKRALALRFRTDRDGYADAKDPVCDRIMDSAERWAVGTDREPGPSDA